MYVGSDSVCRKRCGVADGGKSCVAVKTLWRKSVADAEGCLIENYVIGEMSRSGVEIVSEVSYP